MSAFTIVPFVMCTLSTLSAARLVAIEILAVPLKLAEPVTSPDTAIFLAVVSASDCLAFD